MRLCKKQYKAAIIVSVILLLITFGYNYVLGVIIVSGDVTVDLTITDAYYADIDGDLIEDDVVGNFTLQIDSEMLTRLSLDIRLTLPSGLEYYYSYYLKLAPGEHLGTVLFYNHATESGWYLFSVTCVLFENETLASGTEILAFDPPNGGDTGDDPPTVVLLLS